MRIVWIVPGFSRDETDWCIPALRDLAGEIALRCDLHIVALQYPYHRVVYQAFGATVHSLGGANRGGRHTPGVWGEASRVIQALRPDVLHAFWAYEPGVVAGWFARRVPTIIHLAGGELIDLPDIGYGLRGRRRVRWLMRWALDRARIVTAGSRQLIDMAEKFTGGREIVFAPLGVPSYPSALSTEKFRSREDEQTILNIGSLEPVKDQALLLRAFKRVSTVVPEARLIIAGKGRLEGELHALSQSLEVASRVDFTGEMPHDKLPGLFQQAAVCVQTSRHEAQGMAVLEAAACGVPLVGTAVGAIADLSPKAAVAVPVGDEASLSHALISLLHDPARRKQLGRAAQDSVARDYALTRTADRALMMYGLLASNGHNAID